MRPANMPDPSASQPATLWSVVDGWLTITTRRPDDLVALRKEFGPSTSRNAQAGTWYWAIPESEVEMGGAEFGPYRRKRAGGA